MSARIAEAFAEWRECREAFNEVLYANYERAAEACREALLNARGRAADVDPLSLFMGPAVRAHAYASEELIEHWQQYPRMTFAAFERQWAEERDAEAYRH